MITSTMREAETNCHQKYLDSKRSKKVSNSDRVLKPAIDVLRRLRSSFGVPLGYDSTGAGLSMKSAAKPHTE